jgi:hypothetical protein
MTTLSTEKRIYTVYFYCNLLTLVSNQDIFRELIIEKQLNLNKINGSYLITNPTHLLALKASANTALVRQVNYTSIKVFLNSLEKKKITDISLPSKMEGEFLKLYLKKFQYLYKQYFVTRVGNANNDLSSKELNKLAIKSLLFFIGV